MKAMSSTVIGACFSMSAFSIALIGGLAAHNTAGVTLGRAVLAMLICYPLGVIAGMVCESAVGRDLRRLDGAEAAPADDDDGDGDAAREMTGSAGEQNVDNQEVITV